jgi:transposase
VRPVTTRLPVAPLLELVRVHAGGASSLEIAARLGVDRRTLQHWKHVGVSELQADRAAIAAGFHPLEVWPELATIEEAVSA